MSDTGRSEREWRFYLDDMIAFAQKVRSYTDGLDQPVSWPTRAPTMPRCEIWN
jgi:hypothetical protein